jgi:hypothetical protein
MSTKGPEPRTVVVPVPFRVTYERIEYIYMKSIDFDVTVNGVYLGIVGRYPGEKYWTATVSGLDSQLDKKFPTRHAATASLIRAMAGRLVRQG